jgi:hypothetical protein
LQDARKSEFAFERAIDFVDTAFRARMFRLMNADLLGYGRGELGILPAADNQAEVTVRAMPLVDLGMVIDLMDATDWRSHGLPADLTLRIALHAGPVFRCIDPVTGQCISGPCTGQRLEHVDLCLPGDDKCN